MNSVNSYLLVESLRGLSGSSDVFLADRICIHSHILIVLFRTLIFIQRPRGCEQPKRFGSRFLFRSVAQYHVSYWCRGVFPSGTIWKDSISLIPRIYSFYSSFRCGGGDSNRPVFLSSVATVLFLLVRCGPEFFFHLESGSL